MRTPSIALVPILGLVACGGTNPPPAEPTPSKPAAKAGPVLPAGCQHNVTIDESGKLVVLGEWRGQPVHVVVDTGANSGSISERLVQKYQLPVTGHAKYASATAQFVDTTSYDAGELTIGGATVLMKNVFSHAANANRYDFLIGLDQLESHAMVVDLAREAFCLVDSPHELATEPMRTSGEGPYRAVMVSAKFGGVQLDDMILDTGAGVTTINDAHLARIEHTALPDKVTAVDGTGAEVDLSLVTVPKICVGAACSTDHMVMPSPDMSELATHHIDGIVGLPFFLDHVLVIDFPAKKIGIL